MKIRVTGLTVPGGKKNGGMSWCNVLVSAVLVPFNVLFRSRDIELDQDDLHQDIAPGHPAIFLPACDSQMVHANFHCLLSLLEVSFQSVI